ncbi:Fimbrial protein [Methylophilaceae bacterium]|nr:Fimbrial protein [Methylophilaceae bacterium]
MTAYPALGADYPIQLEFRKIFHQDTVSTKGIAMQNSGMIKSKRTIDGFTLIELMIVVTIVAILSAIALPNYSAYVQRGKIAEATSTLQELRVRMERYYQDNRTYANGANCGVAMPTSPAVEHFTYNCVLPDGNQTYLLTATGKSDKGMSGFVYTIDQNNAKKTTTFKGGTGSDDCWLTRAGAC